MFPLLAHLLTDLAFFASVRSFLVESESDDDDEKGKKGKGKGKSSGGDKEGGKVNFHCCVCDQPSLVSRFDDG